MIVIREFPPVYLLGRSIAFPDLLDGRIYDDLICLGGDLTPERIVTAYRAGLFPWFVEDGIPYWFSPNPRMILEPGALKISKSLSKSIRNGGFELCLDRDFEGVMRGCAQPRPGESGTWIDGDFITAYTQLYCQGVAHSVECYYEGELVGGLYGLRLGPVFFGESMFARRRDASKVALAALCEQMQATGGAFIDCQVPSEHLARLGAISISRGNYLLRLRAALEKGAI